MSIKLNNIIRGNSHNLVNHKLRWTNTTGHEKVFHCNIVHYIITILFYFAELILQYLKFQIYFNEDICFTI